MLALFASLTNRTIGEVSDWSDADIKYYNSGTVILVVYLVLLFLLFAAVIVGVIFLSSKKYTKNFVFNYTICVLAGFSLALHLYGAFATVATRIYIKETYTLISGIGIPTYEYLFNAFTGVSAAVAFSSVFFKLDKLPLVKKPIATLAVAFLIAAEIISYANSYIGEWYCIFIMLITLIPLVAVGLFVWFADCSNKVKQVSDVDPISKLKELKELKDQNLITEDQYNEKSKVLIEML